MKKIIYNNKSISYKTGGAGKPVMLLHGFAETSSVWDHQFKKLKDSFLVIAPDLPGSGNSEMLEGNITIEDYANVIKTIADAESLGGKSKKFALIGHSMGGYISLAFAEKFPEYLNGLGLFHSTAYADDIQKKETRKKGIEFIKKNGAGAFLRTVVPNLFSEKTRKDKPALLDSLLNLSSNFSAVALIQCYEAMIKRPDRTTTLKSFKHPVFFAIGKDDNAIALQSSLEQCYMPAISFIHILQHSGHMGMWEETETSNRILLDFLSFINV
jgi:pimeloyl-ACP methyl ester carboxylesterase